jgi:hypothetical protein
MKKFTFPIVFLLLPYFSIAQENYFKAHEWGTFTTLQNSDGYRLKGLYKDEEKLPDFVKNISYKAEVKGYPAETALLGVTVKMETPVIYFYSNKQTEVSVAVKFNGGSISQWFPERSGGESKEFQMSVDFSIRKTGSIKWNTTVLAPEAAQTNILPEVTGFPQWVAPRKTASNLVKGADNIPEKFLFYRGIGNFEIPVKVEFNTFGNLVITNSYAEELPFVLVYDKKAGQPANIWWSGAIKGRYIKVVQKLTTPTDPAALQQELTKFENGLVKAGLYRDEAKAMLDTWKQSYFEHNGLRVFWIASRAFTDEVLPIDLQPSPQELERVIVGRSEILTPEFEAELKNNLASYSGDRFYEAYKISNTRTIADLTTINKDANMDPTIVTAYSEKPVVSLFPNPAGQTITVACASPGTDCIEIRLYNATGAEIMKFSESSKNDLFTKSIDISTLPAGIYLLNLRSLNKWSHTSKFIKK